MLELQGLSGRDTTFRIKHLMKNLNPLVFCLVETKADNERLDKLCSKIGNIWPWATLMAEGYSGGIIILWQKHIGKVTPIAKTRYALHLVVTTDNAESWILTIVYNSNRVQDQRLVWHELSGMTSLKLTLDAYWGFQWCCFHGRILGWFSLLQLRSSYFLWFHCF